MRITVITVSRHLSKDEGSGDERWSLKRRVADSVRGEKGGADPARASACLPGRNELFLATATYKTTGTIDLVTCASFSNLRKVSFNHSSNINYFVLESTDYTWMSRNLTLIHLRERVHHDGKNWIRLVKPLSVTFTCVMATSWRFIYH